MPRKIHYATEFFFFVKCACTVYTHCVYSDFPDGAACRETPVSELFGAPALRAGTPGLSKPPRGPLRGPRSSSPDPYVFRAEILKCLCVYNVHALRAKKKLWVHLKMALLY